MQLYLPIAELSLNLFLLLGMGSAIGFISGLFGVGGGFLLTPLLIFVGIPAPVAVATSSVHLAASSVTSTLAYWRRNALDLKLGVVLTAGGLVGTLLGVIFFNQMRKLGHLDLVITISYVTLLMSVGSLMFVESAGAALDRHRGRPPKPATTGGVHWASRFPLRVHFERSKMTVSLIPLILLGAAIGFVGTVLGIGGGFLVVPALIYLFRVPTSVVVGTSLFQILVTMCAATFFHASVTQSVDIVLGLTLVVGGVIGAQFGTRAGQALKGEQFRLLLALLILIVGVRFASDLVIRPPEPYSITLQELER